MTFDIRSKERYHLWNSFTHRLTDVFGGEVDDLLVHGPFFIALHDGFLRANTHAAASRLCSFAASFDSRRPQTHLEVDGRHVSQLPGQRDALQDHVSALTRVNVQLHEHAVQVLGLEHADQGAAEQLSTTQTGTKQME